MVAPLHVALVVSTSDVDIVSTCVGLILVVPENTVASYLLDKLTDGAAFCGTLMPMGLPPLSESELDLIREWIEAGAPPADPAPAALSSSTTTTVAASTTTVTAPVATEADDG